MTLFELMPALLCGYFVGLLVGCIWWYNPHSSESELELIKVRK